MCHPVGVRRDLHGTDFADVEEEHAESGKGGRYVRGHCNGTIIRLWLCTGNVHHGVSRRAKR
jgi:hypothetical protein